MMITGNAHHFLEYPMEEEKYNPTLYSRQEMQAIEKHIEKYFGCFDEVLHEILSPDIHVDICVISPSDNNNFYTLVTMGMGAWEMNVPRKWRKGNTRAEILATLPPDWNIKSQNEKYYWPIRWLKILARLPVNEDSWLGWGHSVPNGTPFASNTELSGVLLELPYSFGSGSMICELPSGELVNFYQMIPLYEEEMNFKVNHGVDELVELFDDDFDHVININRRNYCIVSDKTKHTGNGQIKSLYRGKGPQGCHATDRIIVDGCKVGYMYREKPGPESAASDSGWRFTAGDEDDDYMKDPDNSGIYSLNTICNYDPGIIPFLEAGYGTAFYRDDEGEFKIDNGNY